MSWNLDTDRPIYIQIVEEIERRIVSGYYKLGDKIPSVRELATEASVNPNTMQKALSELERNGLLYSQRTSGRFITEDDKMIEDIKVQLAKEKIAEFIESMKMLGYDRVDIIKLIETIAEGK